MIGEALGLFVLIFTSLVGIFTLVRLLADRIFRDETEGGILSILPLKGHEEQVEYLIRQLAARSHGKLIVVDYGMDGETREIVLRLKEEYRNLCILQEGELNDTIKEGLRS